jgi:5-methylcytosine-specific restriction endonuclease McrA
MNKDGTPNFSTPSLMNPVGWDEWIKLPIRDWDFSIRSAKLEIRVPTVLISKNYAKMPTVSFKGKPKKDALFIRDGGIDQYTGKELKYDDATVDHVIPKNRGGQDVWENVALTCHKINSEKGNKLNEEIGLKLLKHQEHQHQFPGGR